MVRRPNRRRTQQGALTDLARDPSDPQIMEIASDSQQPCKVSPRENASAIGANRLLHRDLAGICVGFVSFTSRKTQIAKRFHNHCVVSKQRNSRAQGENSVAKNQPPPYSVGVSVRVDHSRGVRTNWNRSGTSNAKWTDGNDSDLDRSYDSHNRIERRSAGHEATTQRGRTCT